MQEKTVSGVVVKSKFTSLGRRNRGVGEWNGADESEHEG